MTPWRGLRPQQGALEAGPLLGQVLHADELTALLFEPRTYHVVVAQLVEAALHAGATALCAGSSAGDRLIGGMMFAEPSLTMWRPGQVGLVTLIDGVLISSLGLSTTASQLLQLGADRVQTIVVALNDADFIPGSPIVASHTIKPPAPQAA